MILGIVGRIIVRAVLGAAYVHAFPGLGDAVGRSQIPHALLGLVEELGQILIREAILLGFPQRLLRKNLSLVL